MLLPHSTEDLNSMHRAKSLYKMPLPQLNQYLQKAFCIQHVNMLLIESANLYQIRLSVLGFFYKMQKVESKTLSTKCLTWKIPALQHVG